MALRFFVASLALLICGCSDPGPYYGPWGEHRVVPRFAVQTDKVSTTFEGRVEPGREYVFGSEDGFSLTTKNAELTVNAGTVWSYEPVRVGLYDGERGDVGSDETLIASWELPLPDLGERILFKQSRSLERPPRWLRVQLGDFSGQCVFQVIGHH